MEGTAGVSGCCLCGTLDLCLCFNEWVGLDCLEDRISLCCVGESGGSGSVEDCRCLCSVEDRGLRDVSVSLGRLVGLKRSRKELTFFVGSVLCDWIKS